jgi:HprK-related kinase A
MTENFRLRLPPFNFSIQSDIGLVSENIHKIYAPALEIFRPVYPDYCLSVKQTAGLRRYWKPQARFLADQQEPFQPLTLQQGYAMLEWGMNWCIASHEMQYVILHSAVLAKNDKAIVFPAPPGSGKSTLTAYLAFNGWRLLSDEMALILPYSKRVQPFVRPICLKNQSINLAKKWFPDGVFSTIASDTHKGDVIHLSPPLNSWLGAEQQAEIVGIVFPQYVPQVELDIYSLNQTQAFMQLAQNAFNFGVIGREGFETLTTIIEQVPVFDIQYNDLVAVEDFLKNEVLSRVAS